MQTVHIKGYGDEKVHNIGNTPLTLHLAGKSPKAIVQVRGTQA